jgi:hypothetical protein
VSSSPFDLFRQPSKKPRSTPQSGGAPSTPSTKAIPPDSFTPPESKESSFLASTEYKEMLNNMTKMHDDLENKLAAVFERSGWSIQKIKQFLENPNNFNKFEWSRVQQEREHWNKQIWAIVGESGQQRVINQEKKKAADSKKGKFLGARKNWIPIR